MQESVIKVDCYDLNRTIESGQAFHWQPLGNDSWQTAWRGSWYCVSQISETHLRIKTLSEDPNAIPLMSSYLQSDLDLRRILKTFPDDPLMQTAVKHCRGLRLLRQDPWLCLASFILSSTKQITQIKEIVHLLSSRFGQPVTKRKGSESPVYTFPEPKDIMNAGEQEIRKCKAGFRAKYIFQCASHIDSGRMDLDSLRKLTLQDARTHLVSLPGVGPKIADCVLLFAYGFDRAFPIDVWVQRVLQDYYFAGEKISKQEMNTFVHEYFGPNAGFAQQYLFDYIRGLTKKEWGDIVKKRSHSDPK